VRFALIVFALALVLAGALYIRLRWHRSPRAYRAMLALAACYFVAGSLVGAWVLHLTAPKPAEVVAPSSTGISTSLPAPAASAVAAAANPINPLSKFSAKVASITDGDTVGVLAPGGQTYAIRLAGIDAPEHNQAFGSQSTANLAALVSGKTVALECEDERSYGRLICKVLLPNGEDADLDQVKAGLAWHYKQYQDEQSLADRAAYGAAECAAMKAKSGLWGQPNPDQPQDFRHGTHSALPFGPDGCRMSSEPTSGAVIGNARSHIFEWPGCPYYSSISSGNQVPFPSPQAAEQAGYRPAHNCP
jgi:endonuclease YncB( thermonuclease family)